MKRLVLCFFLVCVVSPVVAAADDFIPWPNVWGPGGSRNPGGAPNHTSPPPQLNPDQQRRLNDQQRQLQGALNRGTPEQREETRRKLNDLIQNDPTKTQRQRDVAAAENAAIDANRNLRDVQANANRALNNTSQNNAAVNSAWQAQRAAEERARRNAGIIRDLPPGSTIEGKTADQWNREAESIRNSNSYREAKASAEEAAGARRSIQDRQAELVSEAQAKAARAQAALDRLRPRQTIAGQRNPDGSISASSRTNPPPSEEEITNSALQNYNNNLSPETREVMETQQRLMNRTRNGGGR